MRYLIENEHKNEYIERRKFLNEVFRLYMIMGKEEEGFQIFESLPSNALDVFMIVGHDKSVYEYLEKNAQRIIEKNIVIVSCNAKKINELKIKGKNIYISKNTKGITEYRLGKDFGFEFQITDSELDLYNARGKNMYDTIKRSFLKL